MHCSEWSMFFQILRDLVSNLKNGRKLECYGSDPVCHPPFQSCQSISKVSHHIDGLHSQYLPHYSSKIREMLVDLLHFLAHALWLGWSVHPIQAICKMTLLDSQQKVAFTDSSSRVHLPQYKSTALKDIFAHVAHWVAAIIQPQFECILGHSDGLVKVIVAIMHNPDNLHNVIALCRQALGPTLKGRLGLDRPTKAGCEHFKDIPFIR